MKNQLKNPAMIVAMSALFVALGGTSYAAYSLPKNSVGHQQVKTSAVRSAEVKNRSLKAVDFALGQLPQGEQGPQGPQGVQGPKGAVSTVAVRRKDYTLADGQSNANLADVSLANVECAAGETLISGGGNLADIDHGDAKVTGSGPRGGAIAAPSVLIDGQTPTIWRVTAVNPAGGDATPAVVRVYALCAQ